MNTFTFENQGVNTYLVYKMLEYDEIDTLSLGMITNNKIKGILPVLFTQMDADKYLKYNISSKISLKQYFEGTVTKNRLLTVFLSIAAGVLAAEEYMIDASSFVLDLDYIFVDVSTSEATLVCLPIMTNQRDMENNLANFYKKLVFSTQFDQTENCDYVAKIISFLNSMGTFSLEEFKSMIEGILFQTSSKPDTVPERNITPQAMPHPIPHPIPHPMPQPMPHPMPHPAPQPESVQEIPPRMREASSLNNRNSVSKDATVVNSVGRRIEIPGMNQEEIAVTSVPIQPVEKKSRGLFSKKPKEKHNKNNKNKKEVLPPPYAMPQPMNIPPQPMNVPPQPMNVPPQPMNVPPMNMVKPPQVGFGETTVLTGTMAGETTVLGNNAQVACQPYLIRTKNNERIMLDKPLLRIGKEKSFVDYCISDNPSISRSHANIVEKGGQYYIIDTNSTNHTYINGAMIQSNMEMKLLHGQHILLANEEFEFREY